jgi:hypothetical protein
MAALNLFQGGSVQVHINCMIDDLLVTFPRPDELSADQRRGIIARYTSVLEGNFIYWMTGALLAARTEEARAIILDNLREEIGDCHPGMMRRFALAAHAVPSELDAADVYRDLTSVRLFIGKLSSVQLVLMMAYFEGLIQKFMAYLAELARLQGSKEMEYTDVHGVCDVAHTAGLFRALDAEAALCPLETAADLFQGVNLLSNLLRTIVFGAGRAPGLRAAE